MKTAQSFDELATMMKNTRVRVRALAGFVMQGRDPVTPGEELVVSRSFAYELISGEKAELIPVLAPTAGIPVADPNFMPQIESPPAASAEKPKGKS